eukprot:595063-Pyramimonas_sp.AAC.2
MAHCRSVLIGQSVWLFQYLNPTWPFKLPSYCNNKIGRVPRVASNVSNMWSTLQANVGIAPAGPRSQPQTTRVRNALVMVGAPVPRTSRAFVGSARSRPMRRNTVVRVVADGGAWIAFRPLTTFWLWIEPTVFSFYVCQSRLYSEYLTAAVLFNGFVFSADEGEARWQKKLMERENKVEVCTTEVKEAVAPRDSLKHPVRNVSPLCKTHGKDLLPRFSSPVSGVIVADPST